MNGTMPARILIVDDRAEGRKLLALRLQHAGYVVLQAESGAQALDVAAREPLDLVLLDVLVKSRSSAGKTTSKGSAT